MTLLRLFDNPLPKYLIFKRISCMQWLLCFLPKLRGLRLVFGTKCVMFLYRQLMTPETLRFTSHHPQKQWLTERKRREDRNTKIWISWEKEIFRWNTFFAGFEKLSFGEMKNSKHKLEFFLVELISKLFCCYILTPYIYILLSQKKVLVCRYWKSPKLN